MGKYQLFPKPTNLAREMAEFRCGNHTGTGAIGGEPEHDAGFDQKILS
jgi:hypothetical protein